MSEKALVIICIKHYGIQTNILSYIKIKETYLLG